MARRFSRLGYALKSLQSPLGGTDNNPATGSILANYKDFRDGKKVVNYVRDAASKPGSLVDVGLNPFYSPLGTGEENWVVVKASNRAIVSTAVSAIRAQCNLDTTPSGAYEGIRGFQPAQVIVFVKSGTQLDTKETSQITGVRYNPMEGTSYTLPYGQVTGSLYEEDVRANIITSNTVPATNKLRFTSERRP
jgi:hypothetical protein